MTTDYDEIAAEKRVKLAASSDSIDSQLQAEEVKWRSAADRAVDMQMPPDMVTAFDELASAFRRARHAVAGAVRQHVEPVKVPRRISAPTLHKLGAEYGVRAEAMGAASAMLQAVGDDRKALVIALGALIERGDIRP